MEIVDCWLYWLTADVYSLSFIWFAGFVYEHGAWGRLPWASTHITSTVMLRSFAKSRGSSNRHRIRFDVLIQQRSSYVHAIDLDQYVLSHNMYTEPSHRDIHLLPQRSCSFSISRLLPILLFYLSKMHWTTSYAEKGHVVSFALPSHHILVRRRALDPSLMPVALLYKIRGEAMKCSNIGDIRRITRCIHSDISFQLTMSAFPNY